MSASSYDILKEIGALIIWIFKGFNGKYSACQQNKYAFEVGLVLVICIILLLFVTGW